MLQIDDVRKTYIKILYGSFRGFNFNETIKYFPGNIILINVKLIIYLTTTIFLIYILYIFVYQYSALRLKVSNF